MKNVTRHQGILKVIERLPSSFNGNPRYLLSIDGFTCKTAVDSGYGYSVTNHDGKEVIAYIGTHYGSATLDSLKGV
jgi:hypothetical protein